MSPLNPNSRPFDDVEGVGLAIMQNQIGLHCAFMYKSDEQEVRTLGLAMHYTLEDEPIDSSYRWTDLGLDPDNKKVLGILISRIKNQKPSIPYAFDHSGVVFGADGNLLPPPAGYGLTCATFIVAVLKTYAHELIDIETWPNTPRDARQFEIILRHLQSVAGREYVQSIRSNKGARSINPDEVVSAGSLDSEYWPVDYDTARKMADRVLEDMKP